MFGFIKQIKNRIQKYRDNARQTQLDKKKKKEEHKTEVTGKGKVKMVIERISMFRKKRRLAEIGYQSRRSQWMMK